MKTIIKILVPTDLSNFSLMAMDYAISLAKSTGAQIYMLYVIENDATLAFPSVDRNSETILRDAQRKAREILKHWGYSRLKNGQSITLIVTHGDATKEIVRFVNQERIDLIVMATHGRTGVAHFVIGSVAEKVVRYAPVPVLTVKPKEMQRKYSEEPNVEDQHQLKS